MQPAKPDAATVAENRDYAQQRALMVERYVAARGVKDLRVLVKVKGDKPITVGDLATAMEEKLYHGSKNVNRQKLNKQKLQVLEELAGKRVFLREALNRGLDRTTEYRNSVKDYRAGRRRSAARE